MHTPTLFRRLLVGGALATAVVAGALAPAADARPNGPAVPVDIAVPAGNVRFLNTHAVGVQIYSCAAAAAGPTWSSVAPRADLYGPFGIKIGTHFAGPTWQLFEGSSVVATRDSGVTVDPTAIPWLRLSKVSSSPGRWGDLLGRTTFIQRINTTGGLTPAAAECNPSTVGTVAEVPYTADYAFWMATRR
jgi:hypothetical protein